MTRPEEREWRTARRTVAVALSLAQDIRTGHGRPEDKARKLQMIRDMAEVELEIAVRARGQMLREKFLEAHA